MSNRYEIDLEALCRSNDSDQARRIWSLLSHELQEPGFRLDRKCAPCHRWDDSLVRRLKDKPGKGLAARQASIACQGCQYSYLIPSDEEAARLTDLPTLESKIRASYRALRVVQKEEPPNEVLESRIAVAITRLESEWDRLAPLLGVEEASGARSRFGKQPKEGHRQT